MEQFLFFLFSILALGGGVGVVVLRDPVRGALSLVSCFFCLACLFLLQSAELPRGKRCSGSRARSRRSWA